MLLTIRNSGGKRTKFEIDLGKNDLDLVVNPIRGTIKAKSKVTVIVEMMGMNEGEYFKELWLVHVKEGTGSLHYLVQPNHFATFLFDSG